MSDEIKGKFYSLEELKRTIDCYDGYLDNEEVYYFIGALRFAYDYITNLQEEIKTIKNCYMSLAKICEKRLERYLDYKSRNEKAIEYIKETDTFQIVHCVDKFAEVLRNKTKEDLLNILTGGDNNG